VKRGYWVVRRVLGERIPAAARVVPELPPTKKSLGDLTLCGIVHSMPAVMSSPFGEAGDDDALHPARDVDERAAVVDRDTLASV